MNDQEATRSACRSSPFGTIAIFMVCISEAAENNTAQAAATTKRRINAQAERGRWSQQRPGDNGAQTQERARFGYAEVRATNYAEPLLER